MRLLIICMNFLRSVRQSIWRSDALSQNRLQDAIRYPCGHICPLWTYLSFVLLIHRGPRCAEIISGVKSEYSI